MELDDRSWSDLRHAYGSAENVPGLLRQLRALPRATDARAEPYFSLWSALCHQGQVYTASYAAVPHIVDALLTWPTTVHDSPLQLVVCIEIARAQGRGPAVPGALENSYGAALRRLAGVVQAAAGLALSEGPCRVVAAALAVANGHPRLAEAILELEAGLLDDFMGWVAER